MKYIFPAQSRRPTDATVRRKTLLLRPPTDLAYSM